MASIVHDGIVLNKATQEPVAGLRVEAWDSDGVLPSLVGYAVTGADGEFRMELAEDDVTALFGERTPEAYFKVVLEGGTPYVVADTRTVVVWDLRDPESSSVVFADLTGRTPATPATFVVRGVLVDFDAGPMGGMVVEAYDMRFRSETLIGSDTTNLRGGFAITYAPIAQSSGGPLANLQLRARAAVGQPTLATTVTRCSAPPTLILEFVAGGESYLGVPEADAVTAAVATQIGGTPLSQVTDDELEQIACGTRQPVERVRATRDAEVIATDPLMSPLDINASVFYGLIRQGLPGTMKEILAVPAARLRSMLQAAVDARQIGLLDAAGLEQAYEKLVRAQVDLAFTPPDVGTCNLAEVLHVALDESGSNIVLSRKFTELYARHEGTIEAFWDSVGFDAVALGGCIGWLRANADTYEDTGGTNPCEDGTAVLFWKDQSTTGHHASGVSTVIFRGAGGTSGLDIDGVDLSAAGMTVTVADPSTSYAVVVRLNQASSGSGERVVLSCPGKLRFDIDNGSGQVALYVVRPDLTEAEYAFGATAGPGDHVYTCVIDSAERTANAYVDGTLLGTAADIEVAGLDATTYIGSKDGTSGLVGSIVHELLVFNRALDESELTKVHAYARYGDMVLYSQERVGRLQLTLQWGALSRYHLPLIERLEELRVAGTAPTLRDLAMYTEAQWLAVIESQVGGVGGPTVGYPADIPGADAAEKKANYAAVLARTMEAALPTAHFHGQLLDVMAPADAYVGTFLGDNTTFDFGKTRVASFWEAANIGSIPPEQQDALKTRLKKQERLFKLTKRYGEVKALLDAGLDSSAKVARMGQAQFLEKHGSTFESLEVAKKAYCKAQQVAAHATGIFAQYSPMMHGLEIACLPKYRYSDQLTPAEKADWESLFGMHTLCACKHCRSVYSPAAYLVDLLEFLSRYDSNLSDGGGVAWTARDVLIGGSHGGIYSLAGRRPDIAKIMLSCENTNTVLPYVDLVNEILEQHVAGPDANPPATISVGATSEELLSTPEILDPGAHAAAYGTLAGEVYPWVLPFSLWQAKSRVYLEHLGVPRHELMTLFQKGFKPSDVANCRLWLRADAGVAVANGRIDRWMDLSGLANDAIQDHAGVGPYYGASGGSEDQPYVDFRGAERLYVPDAGSLGIPNSSTATVVVITSGLGNGWVIAKGAFGVAWNYGIQRTGGKLYSVYHTNYVPTAPNGLVWATEGATARITITAQSGTSSGAPDTVWRIDGTGSSAGTSLLMSPTSEPLHIGAAASGAWPASTFGSYLTGRVYEIIVYEGVLSAADLASLEAYAAERYGAVLLPQVATVAPTDLQIAQERLAMTKLERELVVGQGTADDWSMWGLPEGGPPDPHWYDELRTASTFVDASSLSYVELKELLESRIALSWAAAGQTPRLDPKDGTLGCNLDNLVIAGLEETTIVAAWDAFHRFLRLRRRLGWKIRELDKLLAGFGAGLDDTFVQHLAEIAVLRSRRPIGRLKLSELAAWWGDIDTQPTPSLEEPSLYETLFLSKAVDNPHLAAFQLDALAGSIDDRLDQVLGAITMTAADYRLLSDAGEALTLLNLQPAFAGHGLHLTNLSRLFRLVSFARSNRLRMSEFVVMQALTGLAPLAGDDALVSSSPEQTRLFLEELDRVGESGLRIPEIHYLVRHVVQPGTGIEAVEAAIDTDLEQLDAGLAKIVEDTAYQPDASGQTLRALLIEVITADRTGDPDKAAIADPATVAADVEAVMNILEGAPSTDTDADKHARLVDVLGPFFDDEQALADTLVVTPFGASDALAPSCKLWLEGGSGLDADAQGRLVGWSSRIGSASVRLPKPTDVLNCTVWLRADLGVTHSSGKVIRWVNQANPGTDAEQGTGTSQPTFTDDGGVAGYPGIDFDGFDDWLQMAGITQPDEDHTVVVVCRPRAVASTRVIVTGGNLAMAAATPAGKLGYYDGAVWQEVGTAETGDQMLGWVLDGNTNDTGDVYRDGELVGSLDNTLPGVWPAGLELGRGQGTYFDGVVTEVIVYSRVLNNAELGFVNGMLQSRYGLGAQVGARVVSDGPGTLPSVELNGHHDALVIEGLAYAETSHTLVCLLRQDALLDGKGMGVVQVKTGPLAFAAQRPGVLQGSPPLVGFQGGVAWVDFGQARAGDQTLTWVASGGTQEVTCYRDAEQLGSVQPYATLVSVSDVSPEVSVAIGRIPGSLALATLDGAIALMGVFNAALDEAQLARLHEYVFRLSGNERRYERVHKGLLDFVRRRDGASFAKQSLAAAHGLPAESASTLLTAWLRAFSSPTGYLIEDLLPPTFESPTPVADADRRKAVTRFAKSALLLSRLEVDERELTYLAAGPVDGWLDLNDLPVEMFGPIVRFDADRTAIVDGELELPPWLTITCATDGRTIQTSPSTVRSGFGPDAARAHSLDGARFGLAVEPAATNVASNDSIETWPTQGTATSVTIVVPDGSSFRNKLEDQDAAAAAKKTLGISTLGAGWHTLSAWGWVHAAAPTTGALLPAVTGVTPGFAIDSGAVEDVRWTFRTTTTNLGTVASPVVEFVPRHTDVGDQGAASLWGVQIEARRYTTSFTGLASSFQRAADVVVSDLAAAGLPADGYFKVTLGYSPMYASGETAGIHDLVYFDSQNRVYYDGSQLILRVNNVVLGTGAITFDRFTEIRIFAEHAASGRTLAVWIDGIKVGQWTAAALSASPSLPATAYLLGNASGAQEGAILRVIDWTGDDLPEARARYRALMRLVAGLSLRDAFRAKGGSLIELLAWMGGSESPDLQAVLAAIVENTGWAPDDVTGAAAALGLDRPSWLRSEDGLARLRDAVLALKRLGASAPMATSWLDVDESAEDGIATADAILRAAKAKHDPAAWPEVARPLRDPLREAQREALVAYAVKSPPTDPAPSSPIESADDLYAYLLVDVEMSPCMLTSRIKHAISTVQLFVQRCLLNVEQDVPLGKVAAREYAWMRNYRVWEANRKVFLYPENWLEPEWRDDKTPLFERFESKLKQGELDDERAEGAFAEYLEGLGEVAKLDIAGMVHHAEAGTSDKLPVDTLHVLGRTYSERPRYYHRSWVDRTTWTPWRLVDIEINSDHFIPIIVNGRLVIVGTTFEDAVYKETEERTITQYQTRWWWSELRGDAWTPPVLGRFGPKWPLPGSPRLDAFSLYRILTEDAEEIHALGPFVFQVFHSPTPLTVKPNRAFARASFGACANLRVGPINFDAQSFRYLPEPTPLKPAALDYVIDYPNDGFGFQGNSTFGIWSTTTKPVALLTSAYDYTVHAERIASTTKTIVPFHQFFFKFASGQRNTYFVHPVLAPPSPTVASDGTVVEDDPNVLRSQTWSDPVTVTPKTIAEFHDTVLLAQIGTWAVKPAISMYVPLHLVRKYLFETHHHPYVCDMVHDLRRGGPRGVQRWTDQFLSDEGETFSSLGPVDENVARPWPADNFDFSHGGAYSVYNWELFFHAPFLIATRLMAEERHEEAREWLHAIFDPTEAGEGALTDEARRFWKIKPFYLNDDLADVQAQMSNPDTDNPKTKELQALFATGNDDNKLSLERQIAAWRKDPFRPFLIARMRIAAFQRATVVRYIDNLIAWGDKLFRRDTIESVGEATQLYLLAKELLGDRPKVVDDPNEQAPLSYAEALAQGGFDAFSNHAVELESLAVDPPDGPCGQAVPPAPLVSFYFCFPSNDKLLGLWDLAEDRLFKIRHCMNIEGIVRELPLFEPPIDPAILIDAVASGVDIQSVLDDLAAPQPHYRFSVLMPKAVEFVQTVVSFGGSLLAALEKRDGEQLSLLRQRQEIGLLDMVRQVRKDQIGEAKETVASLKASRKVAEERLSFYQSVIRISPKEQTALAHSEKAADHQQKASDYEVGANGAAMFPDLSLGVSGMGPANWTVFGGTLASRALTVLASSEKALAGRQGSIAQTAATLASYDRRWDDWKLQERLADLEIKQIDKQIASAEVRVAIAEGELRNTEQQREDARAVEEFLKTKFTSDKLYDWTVEQLSELYYQAYKVAYELCKAAEQAYKYERAEPDAHFMKFGYWNSRRKGLVAGEKLLLDLRRMEAAYLKKNRREYELVKSVSLAEHFPDKLVELRETGKATISLREMHFDLDYPGHYMRRVKSASITIPAVTGPHGGVHCTLTLLKSRIRAESVLTDGEYVESQEPALSDPRFIYHYGAVSSVCTSSGQNDAGLFELNFRDERYLPFEGAGAVSEWRIELPPETNQFDLRTVSDVVLNLSYTAREGGSALKSAALEAALGDAPREAWRLFRASQDFASAWEAFQSELEPGTNDQVLTLSLAGKLPFVAGVGEPEVADIRLSAVWADKTADVDVAVSAFTNPAATIPVAPLFVPEIGGASRTVAQSPAIPVTVTVPYTVIAALPSSLRESYGGALRIKPEALVDLLILVKVERESA